MTNTEFSDSFDVLLNSYNTKAEFGDQASKREIVLDEYEKSVLLTQAQDIIVKSYFDRNLNSEGKGFDDGTKRQVDFSSLIKVEDIYPVHISTPELTVRWGDNKGSVAVLKVTNKLSIPIHIKIEVVEYIGMLNIRAFTETDDRGIYGLYIQLSSVLLRNIQRDYVSWVSRFPSWFPQELSSTIIEYDSKGRSVGDIIDLTISAFYLAGRPSIELQTSPYIIQSEVLVETTSAIVPFDERGVIYTLPYKEVDGDAISNVLFILNEKLIVDGKNYVIVPINYQEYDREMSKPYGQPLKRQAWRLIQNVSTGFDIHSELIPKWNIDISDATYRIRYVRRPRPIVLEDFENLDIDGVSTETSCELNPILHNEILQKAFEIAVQTRGGGSAAQPERQERRG